jgi:hypothetical protein
LFCGNSGVSIKISDHGDVYSRKVLLFQIFDAGTNDGLQISPGHMFSSCPFFWFLHHEEEKTVMA